MRKPVTKRDKIPWKPGDILWVREAWRASGCRVAYEADGACGEWDEAPGKERHFLQHGWLWHYSLCTNKGLRFNAEDYGPHWKPACSMPERFARLFLKVVSAATAPLQSMTESDAKLDGAIYPAFGSFRKSFQIDWDKKYGQSGPASWEANPLVLAIEFEVIPAGSIFWNEAERQWLRAGNPPKWNC